MLFVGAYLESEALAGRVEFGRRRVMEQAAEVDKVFLSGGRPLRLVLTSAKPLDVQRITDSIMT